MEKEYCDFENCKGKCKKNDFEIVYIPHNHLDICINCKEKNIYNEVVECSICKDLFLYDYGIELNNFIPHTCENCNFTMCKNCSNSSLYHLFPERETLCIDCFDKEKYKICIKCKFIIIDTNRDYLLFNDICVLCHLDMHDNEIPIYYMIKDKNIKEKLIEDTYDSFSED